MSTEQELTLAGLKKAIQLEIDGKSLYLKASENSGNDLGKDLLKSLASEEDIHRRKFEEIYNALRLKKAWPKTTISLDSGRAPRTIFAEARNKKSRGLKVPTSELESTQVAIDMESKTYDFYRECSQKASYPAEKEFYAALAAQEMEHRLVLNDYYEYLSDPAAFFVAKEHPSLDGG